MTDIKAYYDSIRPRFISWSFYSQYLDKEPPFGAIGLMVFLRTYSHYIPQLKRRECWAEVILRCVEFSLSLESKTLYPEQVKEAESLFDSWFNLKSFPAGRTLWVGNPNKDLGAANYNCSFRVIDEIAAFSEICHLLMLGAGVGFSVENKYIKQLPSFYGNKVVEHLPYNYIPSKQDDTQAIVDGRIPCDKENFAVFHKAQHIKIIVGDSRQGWEDALHLYLAAFSFSNVSCITLDYSFVRPKGYRLKTMGGRASGHEPLMSFFQKIHWIMFKCKNRLSSVDVLDIVTCLAESIVVGGVRRSALMVLGDQNDEAFKTIKTDLWNPLDEFTLNLIQGLNIWDVSRYKKEYLFARIINLLDSKYPKYRWQTSRVLSNNSLMLFDFDADEMYKNFVSILNNGEPGLFHAKTAQAKRPDFQGTNPCFSGDTLVLTRQGHQYIRDLVNTTPEIWDGQQWVYAPFKITGVNQDVFRVTLSNGLEIKATKYHTFILRDGSRCELKDLKVGDQLQITQQQFHGSHHEKAAYLKGFLLGDGTKASRTYAKLDLHLPKYVCESRLLESLKQLEATGTRVSKEGLYSANPNPQFQTAGHFRQISLAAFPELLKFVTTYRSGLPIQEMLNWSLESKLEFLAGYFDADGTTVDGKKGFGYQISSVGRQILQDVQLLLLSLGIQSHLNLSKKAGIHDFKDRGGLCHVKDVYRLSFPQKESIKFAQICTFSRLKDFSDKEVKYNFPTKHFCVQSVEFDSRQEYVYCCNVETNHSFQLTSGVLSGNCGEILLRNKGVCNLVEANVKNFISPDNTFDWVEFEKTMKLITRHNIRITEITFWDKEWDKVQKEDRLLGVSMTGLVETFNHLGWQDEDIAAFYRTTRKIVHQEAFSYAHFLGIPKPLLVTTQKPSGSVSSLPTVSSGIHAPFAPYFIRRVRVSAVDPIAKALLDLQVPVCPENGYKDLDSSPIWVFSFYVKSDAQHKSTDESALTQLQRYKLIMENYVDHNCSITVTFREHEIPEIVSWLQDHLDLFIGISFLPVYEGGAYPNLPYEAITEEQYLELSKNQKPLTEKELNLMISQYEVEEEEYDLGDSCSTGACPIR